jgi:hypothetical protein
MDTLLEKELRKLVKSLRRQASVEYKKVKGDTTHYEGMCKGMYIGYEEAANRLMRIISSNAKNGGSEINVAHNFATDDGSVLPELQP